jgi:DNA-binding transcriptional LysR family regulator
MLKIESIQAFTSIAEAGSITGAARRLALSKSVISERLAELERILGARLVRRSTRTLTLTDDGKAFFERAKNILRDVDSAVSELTERRRGLSGPLRISAPVSFGALHLGPALFGFLVKHPAIELSLDLDDRFVDLVSEGYDLVVRHGPVNDARVIVKRLATSRRLLVASSTYLKRAGQPASLDDLARHRGVIYSNRGAVDWRFRVGRKFVTVRPEVALRVNNGMLMRDAAIAGLGLALLPTFLLEAPLKARSLRVLDMGFEAEGAIIHIAYPEHLRSSAKIRALTIWLQGAFRSPAHWEIASFAVKQSPTLISVQTDRDPV